ncbi:MAG: right-handed parallel beta-helix repeat-containing protein, partial [Blastocatellia bacterium]
MNPKTYNCSIAALSIALLLFLVPLSGIAQAGHGSKDGPVPACTTISAPGVYTLTKNLSTASGDCLDVKASFVTIQLSGFSITGGGEQVVGAGIKSVGPQTAITILGPGEITLFGTAIDLSSTTDAKILETTEEFNGNGVLTGASCKLIDNIVHNVYFGNGVSTGSSCLLKENVISGVSGTCLAFGSSCVVVQNSVSSCGQGIQVGGTGNNLDENTANFNNTDGIDANIQSGNTLVANTADNNTSAGINVLCPSNLTT